MKNPRRPDIVIKEAVLESFRTVLTFDFAFGETVRRNGAIIVGSPRDTYDVGTLAKNVKILRKDRGFQVVFKTSYASVVFKSRPELLKLLTESLNYEEIMALELESIAKLHNKKVKNRAKRLRKKRKKR